MKRPSRYSISITICLKLVDFKLKVNWDTDIRYRRILGPRGCYFNTGDDLESIQNESTPIIIIILNGKWEIAISGIGVTEEKVFRVFIESIDSSVTPIELNSTTRHVINFYVYFKI